MRSLLLPREDKQFLPGGDTGASRKDITAVLLDLVQNPSVQNAGQPYRQTRIRGQVLHPIVGMFVDGPRALYLELKQGADILVQFPSGQVFFADTKTLHILQRQVDTASVTPVLA